MTGDLGALVHGDGQARQREPLFDRPNRAVLSGTSIYVTERTLPIVAGRENDSVRSAPVPWLPWSFIYPEQLSFPVPGSLTGLPIPLCFVGNPWGPVTYCTEVCNSGM